MIRKEIINKMIEWENQQIQENNIYVPKHASVNKTIELTLKEVLKFINKWFKDEGNDDDGKELIEAIKSNL